MKHTSPRLSSYEEMKTIRLNSEFCINLNKLRDKCIKRGEFENIVKIESGDKKTKKVLTKLFKDTLNLKYNLKFWTKFLIQYGDFFIHLHIDKKKGIEKFTVIPIEEIYREEGFNGKIDVVRFRWENANTYFEDWQMIHFRIISSIETLPYGKSVFNSKGELNGDENSIIEDVKEALEIELNRIANVHLYFLGYKENIGKFSIKL